MAGMSSHSLSTKSNSADFDLPTDPDMKLAKKVVTAMTTDIVGIIQHDIKGAVAYRKQPLQKPA